MAVDDGVDAVDAEAPLVGIEDIRAAARGLVGVAVRTPLVLFGTGSPRVFLKAESLQSIGAFKIRGAYHALASLTEAERAQGVVTHSSGNHAQGVARAARVLGIHAVIVMPADAPSVQAGSRRGRWRRDRHRRHRQRRAGGDGGSPSWRSAASS